ncbi:DUF2968 domain-containing protein [Dyella kyungheensis]|jgi:hypothetical protein|uniref:DUF2968 domain-containing protein n=1 Tax=Dyella kyungheensis TaxID=1242174 RepID=A0ABS2JXS8_9GAMM|nr:DUF2968 domain-containing protein [Dyella kyungheensis]MBM7123605.1 DUF2968 domain-containing protein [Dyella kyungheensis]
MKALTRSASPRRVLFAIGTLVLMATSACASAPATSNNPMPPAPEPAASTQSKVPLSTVESLRQLIDNHQLTEVRTTYNSTYGASLLFRPETLGYYVVLFHGKEFWRVMQTDSFDDAESLYRTFVSQTQTLGQVEIDTMRLDAGNKYAEHMIAVNQAKLRSLQQDANNQQQQAQQVAAQQEQAHQQAVALSSDLHNTNAQLDAVKQQIRALETMQSNPNLVLPTPAPATTAAPTPQPNQPPAASP